MSRNNGILPDTESACCPELEEVGTCKNCVFYDQPGCYYDDLRMLRKEEDKCTIDK